ncbi:MAG: hypothetical protein EAZ78_21320 [Oscillatoriales cyanobacterium]|nr:MAG: hypothetical protein EAZ98_03915 [Oscillatoriales cyanobacterium]TAE99872.1 MAG: hypothetical protein EAZ78_21320 [Oscillatoriales cyanobacterium]
MQTLRSAQSEAKRSKRDITVTFNPTPATDPPTVTINPPLPTGGSTQTLNAGGEIKPGTITLVSNANSITFNYLGNVDQLPQDTSVNPSVKRFVVMVKPTGGGAKKCVLIETILGAMITDEGSRCTL